MSKEVRDKLARLEGKYTWDWEAEAWRDHDDRILADSDGNAIHPIPDDLNTCAAMWDEYAGRKEAGAWEWIRKRWMYVAWAYDHDEVWVDTSGTDAASELRDRWALLGEVLKARWV